jgi:AraC family transcriptional regulator
MRESLRQFHPPAAPASPHRIAAGAWSAELLPRHAYCASYTAEAPVIGFAFDAQSGTHAFGSDRRSDFHTKPNGLAYVPQGCDVYSRSDVGGEYLRIALRPSLDQGRPPRFSDVIDSTAIDAAHRLRRALLAREDALDCERWVLILKERTATVLQAPSRRRSSERWMTPQRLRLVDELIEARLDARLDARLTVQDIADALGLSAGFFCRAFRTAIGQSPHDHIIDRRVARARTLLADAALDLSTIALASGFASHAHMTATFRRRLGVTPRELR